MRKINLLLIMIILSACNLYDNSSEDKEVAQEKTVKDAIISNYFHQKDSSFKHFILNKIGKENTNHIHDIDSLKRLEMIYCDSLSIHYKDTIDKNAIELIIKLQDFKPIRHQIKYANHYDYQDCEQIDNQFPFGGYYGCPQKEIEHIEITINDEKLDLGNTFSNFYDLEMCDILFKYFSPNPLLTYSKENQQFQIYIIGGNAANAYFGKVIFDKKRIIAKYVIGYSELSEQGVFFSEFKAF